MSKFITLPVLIIIFIALYFWRFRSPKSPQIQPNNVLPTSVSSSHQLSIDSLSRRTYTSSLTIDKTIRQTSSYTSKIISYPSDDLKLYALMNIPTGPIPATGWPVVIVNHGHIDPKIYSTANSYINTSAFYASHGFMVFKPDYRGHGQSAGQADTVSARINYAVDVLNLFAAIKKIPDINLNRVYLYGHSMGGDVSLRVLEVCPTCFAGATLWAPAVTDFPESFLYFARRRLSSNNRLNDLTSLIQPVDYASVSTLAQINRLSTPIIIHHSNTDASVPFTWGENLYQALKNDHKSVQFYSYPNDNHDIAGHWSTALGRDLDFFNSTAPTKN